MMTVGEADTVSLHTFYKLCLSVYSSRIFFLRQKTRWNRWCWSPVPLACFYHLCKNIRKRWQGGNAELFFYASRVPSLTPKCVQPEIWAHFIDAKVTFSSAFAGFRVQVKYLNKTQKLYDTEKKTKKNGSEKHLYFSNFSCRKKDHSSLSCYCVLL